MQQKQTVEFATITKIGIVQKIGKSSILQPKPNFQNTPDLIKWYPDRSKQKAN